MTEFNQLGLDCEQVISFRDIWSWVITSSIQFKYFCQLPSLCSRHQFFYSKGRNFEDTQAHERGVFLWGTPL